jgi:hypothetical protein
MEVQKSESLHKRSRNQNNADAPSCDVVEAAALHSLYVRGYCEVSLMNQDFQPQPSNEPFKGIYEVDATEGEYLLASRGQGKTLGPGGSSSVDPKSSFT